ncbi:hypothetical protein MHLP_03975 [Candidatus Mycoplasma haematolamae str. Purdue]|uniref:Uncharacterized protein n=1 Tax=Mycoplasma haematolamae (strain Purdue) TaxID=1212765 RepID=I7BAM6_MYCHA|nr:hypothetical protein [Candidatus Mycoplasma haematolamae]AFO52375.1 hypothetical protein MHLP_03975 [Candidatus Mycoplasma haematolamae str. Purdue]
MGILSNLLYSKFKSVFILGGSVGAGGAVAIPAITSGDWFDEPLFREFDPKFEQYSTSTGVSTQASSSGSYTEDPSKLENFKSVKGFTNSELIRGTKRYNSGNYVLYFGSEACPNCNNFLYSDTESPKVWIGSNQNPYKNGILYETYNLAKNKQNTSSSGKTTKLSDVKFIFFSDEIPDMGYRNNDDLARIPWTTWDKTIVSQGKIKDDYVRYDKSALQFRKIQSLLLYYFGEKATGIPTVIIYREGVPFVYGKDKIDALEAEKKNAGEATSSLQEAVATTAEKDIILRFDLFKHLNYIYNSEIIWVNS